MKSYTSITNTTNTLSRVLSRYAKTSRQARAFTASQEMIADILARSFYMIDKTKNADTKFLGSIPNVHVKPAKIPQVNLDIVSLLDFSIWIPNGAYHFTVRWEALTDVFDIELLAGSREHAKPFHKIVHIDKLDMLDTWLACYIHGERGASSSDCGVYLNWHTMFMFMLLLCSAHFVDPRLKKMFDTYPNITVAVMLSRDIYDALLDFRNADKAVYAILNAAEHPYSFKESEYTKLEKRMVKRLAADPITFGDLLRLFSHKGTF